MGKLSSTKSRRLHELAQADVDNMCMRYQSECVDLGSHKATQEEIAEFEKKLHKEPYLQYISGKVIARY